MAEQNKPEEKKRRLKDGRNRTADVDLFERCFAAIWALDRKALTPSVQQLIIAKAPATCAASRCSAHELACCLRKRRAYCALREEEKTKIG